MSSKKLSKTRSSDPFLSRESQRYETPLPSREFVVQTLEDAGCPVPFDELATLLDIAGQERDMFQRRLAAMEREGQLLKNRKGAYILPERASLIFVPRATLGAWIEASPIFSRRLMHLLADDVADLYEELEGLQNRSTLERLACYLHCGEGRVRRGEPLREEYALSLPYMKLAQRLGTSQPHLSRALRNLEDAGVISRCGRRIRIADRPAFVHLLCTACQQAA